MLPRKNSTANFPHRPRGCGTAELESGDLSDESANRVNLARNRRRPLAAVLLAAWRDVFAVGKLDGRGSRIEIEVHGRSLAAPRLQMFLRAIASRHDSLSKSMPV